MINSSPAAVNTSRGGRRGIAALAALDQARCLAIAALFVNAAAGAAIGIKRPLHAILGKTVAKNRAARLSNSAIGPVIERAMSSALTPMDCNVLRVLRDVRSSLAIDVDEYLSQFAIIEIAKARDIAAAIVLKRHEAMSAPCW